jgi:hypothetical protein
MAETMRLRALRGRPPAMTGAADAFIVLALSSGGLWITRISAAVISFLVAIV